MSLMAILDELKDRPIKRGSEGGDPAAALSKRVKGVNLGGW